MRVTERLPAMGFFSGARTFEIRSVPAGARIRSTRLTITPIADGIGTVGPAIEELVFEDADGNPTDVAFDPNDRDRQTGVTRITASGAPPWTELSFQSRRTLDGVEGSGLAATTLQVDVGGLYVDVDANGTVPADTLPFTLPSNDADLPGLTVSRLKLTAGGATVPAVREIRLRAVASNLTLAFGGQPPVWAYPGEVATAVETAELAEFLQVALNGADTEGGFAVIPITLTTGTTALLEISMAIEYDEIRDVLPKGLDEATLEYAHGAVSEAGDDLLTITVPSGAKIDPAGTRVEVSGTFDGSEITYGPLIDRAPAGAIGIGSVEAAAQPVVMTSETVLDGIDLLMSTSDIAAVIEVDIREDFDGKPGDLSLLPARAKVSIDRSTHGTARWVSAALQAQIKLPAADPSTGKPRFWVILQSTLGAALWHLNGTPESGAELQTSTDGGLSWRPGRVAGLEGALAADLRFRRATPVFSVPLSVEVGRGAEAERIDLDEFQPLGRIDFALNSRTFARAANDVLVSRRANACPRGEQLRNGTFADRGADVEIYEPAEWIVSGGAIGRLQFTAAAASGVSPLILVIGDLEGPPRSISQVRPVTPGCAFELTFRGFQRRPASRVELIWRGPACAVSRVDTLVPPVFRVPSHDLDTTFFGTAPVAVATSTAVAFLPSAQLRTTAPDDAQQVEVRVISGDGAELFLDEISLISDPQAIVNADLSEVRLREDSRLPEFVGWSLAPEDAGFEDGFRIETFAGMLVLLNEDRAGRTLTLSQSLPAPQGAGFAAEIVALSDQLEDAASVPSVALRWMDLAGLETGAPSKAEIVPGAPERSALRGSVPTGTEAAEIFIEIPSGSVLAIGSVALELRTPDEIPVSFLSEAPGNLRIRRFSVGFCEEPVHEIVVPPESMCAPTPSDRAPGDVCEIDPCKPSKAQEMLAAPRAIRARERASGTALLAAASARMLASGRLRTISDTALTPLARPVETTRSVRDVPDVGRARTAALESIGVTTIRHLALADVRDLARSLGLSRTLARELVSNARAELRSAAPGFQSGRAGR